MALINRDGYLFPYTNDPFLLMEMTTSLSGETINQSTPSQATTGSMARIHRIPFTEGKGPIEYPATSGMTGCGAAITAPRPTQKTQMISSMAATATTTFPTDTGTIPFEWGRK